MDRDQVFNSDVERGSDFEFNEEVAKVFDDMLTRSVPFYVEQQSLIKTISQQFYKPGTKIIDLGCSTGTTLIHLAKTIPAADHLVGFDNSHPMLEKARGNTDIADVADRIELNYADLNGDLSNIDFSNASIVTLCWTLQFIRPLQRDALVKKVYDNMVDGGVLIVTEKVLTNDSHMNRFFIDFYYDFKRNNGYTEDEIAYKREALENVLIPYRFDENFELFRRNGFNIVETFFQWFNFAGILCVKNAS
ncbi:MAG: carboxy-S-adenosyl-L-methionine synthase CmoA [Pseudomonadales bacterium]